MKQRFTYPSLIICLFLILFTGCGKDKYDYSHANVHVVLSPKGVGDQGYNDNILRGFQKAANQYGFTLTIHIPNEKEQGIYIYEDWLNSKLDDECQRSLFVFSGSEYEYLLEELTPPAELRKDVLMFETDKQVDGIYTFSVGCYAASYLAGASCIFEEKEDQKALIIAANPHDKNVKRAVDGYRDGYVASGGFACDVYYLSNELDGGYQMQNEAYQYCMKNIGKYSFYFAVAGASNKGLYRFSRENMEFAVGMDNDMSLFSYMLPMSVVKHMDKAITDILKDLLNNKTIPYHQSFTYSSGYEELVFENEQIAELYRDITDIRKHIVEIEKLYEESHQ